MQRGPIIYLVNSWPVSALWTLLTWCLGVLCGATRFPINLNERGAYFWHSLTSIPWPDLRDGIAVGGCFPALLQGLVFFGLLLELIAAFIGGAILNYELTLKDRIVDAAAELISKPEDRKRILHELRTTLDCWPNLSGEDRKKEKDKLRINFGPLISASEFAALSRVSPWLKWCSTTYIMDREDDIIIYVILCLIAIDPFIGFGFVPFGYWKHLQDEGERNNGITPLDSKWWYCIVIPWMLKLFTDAPHYVASDCKPAWNSIPLTKVIVSFANSYLPQLSDVGCVTCVEALLCVLTIRLFCRSPNKTDQVSRIGICLLFLYQLLAIYLIMTDACDQKPANPGPKEPWFGY